MAKYLPRMGAWIIQEPVSSDHLSNDVIIPQQPSPSVCGGRQGASNADPRGSPAVGACCHCPSTGGNRGLPSAQSREAVGWGGGLSLPASWAWMDRSCDGGLCESGGHQTAGSETLAAANLTIAFARSFVQA